MTAPMPFAPKPSILDRILGRLIPTGQYGDLLDPSQTRALRGQGLLNLGTGILAQSGPGTGPLQAFGKSYQGLDMQGMADHALKLQAYRKHLQEEAALQSVVQAHPPKEGESAYDRLTAIVNDIATLPGSEKYMGPLTNALAQLRPQREARERARYVFKELEDPPGSGRFTLFRVNEDDPTDKIRIGTGRPPMGTSNQRADKLKASALLALAENALPTLEQATPPSAVEAVLGSPLGQKLGGQALLNEQRQLTNQAGTQFSDAILRFTSGANTPEPEVQRYLGFITPSYGDAPALRARKLSAQRAIVKALRTAAGQSDEVDPNMAVSIIVKTAQGFQPQEDGEAVPERFAP